MHMRLLKQLSARRTLARWPARLLVGVLAGSFFLFLGIPLAALIIREPPAMLWQAIQRPEAIEALQLSLITTTISTLLTLVFGLPVATYWHGCTSQAGTCSRRSSQCRQSFLPLLRASRC